MKLFKKLFLGLLLLPLLISPLNAQVVRPVVGPVVYDVVWGVTSYAGMVDAIQTLNITSTENIETWQAKYAPNDPFTRTGEINLLDFERVLQTGIPTDVMGMYGGRRVTNLCTYSQDISNTVWLKDTGATIIGTDGFLADSVADYVVQNITTIEGCSYVFSFNAYVETGQLTGYKFRHAASATGTTTELPTLSRETKRYSVEVLGRVGDGLISFGFQDSNASDFVKVIITNFQVEYVTGQTNQNPSDHIPTTTAAVIKFYDTDNGNIVSSNVVTEAAGAELENVIGGAFWPSTTNVIGSAQYRDFSHADWNKVNGSITAGDVVLIDGTTVADKNTFTASAANGTIILDPYVSASGVHSGGVFIKRKTGSGVIEVTIDGGSTWVAVTSQVAGDSGWHLCQTTLPTVTDPEFGVRLVTDTDAVYLDWAQLDDGNSRVSSHSIGGGETLGEQDFHYTNNKLIKASKGSIYVAFEALPDYSAFINNTVILSNGDCEIRAEALTSGISFNDGTNDTTGSAGTPSEKVKAVIVWEGTSVKITTINGTTTGTYAGNFGNATIYTGRNSTGSAFAGYISKIEFYYNQALSDVEADLLVAESLYIPIGYVRVVDGSGNYIVDESGLYIIAPR